MPVWHEATKKLRAVGKLNVVGIVQEQHPDRAALYAQWKQFDWPILVDSLNQLEVTVVPIVLFLDRQGVVRRVLRDPKELEAALADDSEIIKADPGSMGKSPPPELGRASDLVFFAEPPRFDDALGALRRAAGEHGDDGRIEFALGVVHRARYDSPHRQPGDFQDAVRHWQRAIRLDPNQYIWRRRLQQYGPRMDKPYAFYNWVDTARAEIRARGEEPVELAAKPTAAELAEPRQKFVPSSEQSKQLSASRSVTADEGLIDVEAVIVPPVVSLGETVHVYISYRPSPSSGAKWNNESGPMEVLLDLPNGWEASEPRLTVPLPPEPVSGELRTVEFELRAPNGGGDLRLPSAVALYHVCRGESGECLYRRLERTLELDIRDGE